MMKLDEAINHCEEVALSCAKSNRECALEHVQLMQWLKELRALRKLVKPKHLDVLDCKNKYVNEVSDDIRHINDDEVFCDSVLDRINLKWENKYQNT